MNRLSFFGRIDAGWGTPKQAHHAQSQTSTQEGGEVKRDDRHNDYEKWSIHENRQSGLAGDLLE